MRTEALARGSNGEAFGRLWNAKGETFTSKINNPFKSSIIIKRN
jgi:hypothetical protein